MSFAVTAKMEVQTTRGWEPSVAELEKALRRFLKREEIHLSVTRGKEFVGSRVYPTSVDLRIRKVKPRHGKAEVESMLRNTGALKIGRLIEHGFRRQDIDRWLAEGVLYKPYGKKSPDVVMAKR